MEKELMSMTVSELKEYAAKRNVILPSNVKKVDIIISIMRNKYQKMKVAELEDYAMKNGIFLSSTKKAEIIEEIIDAKKERLISDNSKEKKAIQEQSLLTEPGRTVLKKRMGYGRYELGVFTICSKCGEEIFASYLTNTEVETANRCPGFVKLFAKCPKCEKNLGLVNGRFIERYTSAKHSTVFKELRTMIEENKRTELRQKFVNSSSKRKIKDQPVENNAAQSVLSSVDFLKKYILYLIHIETEIYFLNECLVELKLREYSNEQSFLRAQIIVNKEIEKEYKDYREHILDEIAALECILEKPGEYVDEGALIIDTECKEPIMPLKPTIAKPIEPVTPELKRPGLFNKKKVLQENELLLARFKEEKQTYETFLQQYIYENEQYVQQCKIYKEKLNEYEKEYKKAKIIAIKEEIERILEENSKKLKDKENELSCIEEKYKQDIEEKIKSLPQIKISEFLVNEQNTIKEELKKIIKSRDELYSYNVIYEKYRNYVALTTFYEYLDSGRCASLEGSNGAYNLYEAESRSNEIIVQLNAIADSLDIIKNNQYLLYQEMKQVNSNLKEMNTSLSKAIYYLSSIDSTTSMSLEMSMITAQASIATAYNTAATAHYSAITAHNSAITAHYSKINAELTDALGFMIALK